MQMNVATDGVLLTPDIDELVQKKLNQKLDKYLSHLPSDTKQAEVRLKRQSRWGFKVTFDVTLPGGKHIHAEEINKELNAAITIVSEEAERQLRREKERLDPSK